VTDTQKKRRTKSVAKRYRESVREVEAVAASEKRQLENRRRNRLQRVAAVAEVFGKLVDAGVIGEEDWDRDWIVYTGSFYLDVQVFEKDEDGVETRVPRRAPGGRPVLVALQEALGLSLVTDYVTDAGVASPATPASDGQPATPATYRVRAVLKVKDDPGAEDDSLQKALSGMRFRVRYWRLFNNDAPGQKCRIVESKQTYTNYSLVCEK
jgi:hypothetical protein